MSRIDDVVAQLRAFAGDSSTSLTISCDDIAAICDRYNRAIELLHMFDRPDARHPDVAAFLDDSEGGNS